MKKSCLQYVQFQKATHHYMKLYNIIFVTKDSFCSVILGIF